MTVVATGLGREFVPTRVVDNTTQSEPRKSNGEVDYGELDKPAVNRVRRSQVQGNRPAMTGHSVQAQSQQPISTDATARKPEEPRADPDMDYLDIPAFLRRQAD